MIKINYKNPEQTETQDDISKANIIISDKFKKGDYLEMSCISWLKIDSKRDYQDLEQLFRYLNLDSHIIAHPITIIPENLQLGYPNENPNTENLEYVIKISCKPKEDALKELLSIHSSYEENFECLKKAGCLMVKKTEPKEEVQETLSNTKGVNEVKQVLEGKLKLDFAYFKPMESINFIIEDLIKQHGKTPEEIICGEINGKKVYALMLDGQIASPIGWMEKNTPTQTISTQTTNMQTLNSNVEIEYELIDFRTIKMEKQ